MSAAAWKTPPGLTGRPCWLTEPIWFTHVCLPDVDCWTERPIPRNIPDDLDPKPPRTFDRWLLLLLVAVGVFAAYGLFAVFK
jgi:hypothetical protein